MKIIKLVPVYIMLALGFSITAFAQNNNAAKPAKKGFAVLELFTSEGCSSCPPADELMGKIQEEYKANDVYVLSYHVDYWDNQGWKDVFASPDYTKRQYQYGEWLGVQPIYTPQLIINGKAQYIGSQAADIRAALKKAFVTPTAISLSLNGVKAKNSVVINYTTNSTSKNARLHIAVVQKSAKSNVKRGENSGRVLSHYQIVRHLHTTTIGKGGKGSVTVQVASAFNTIDYEIVGFIQDIATGSILGVTTAGF